MTWRAGVERDWQRDVVRLYVGEQWGSGNERLLMRDGTWQEAEPGGRWEGAGIELPQPALGVVLDALMEYRGLQLHQTTEAKVLREWLAQEQRRVDTFLEGNRG